MSAKETSPPQYYPPRAQWYTHLWYPWFRLKRALGLDRLRRLGDVKIEHVAGSLLLPTYGFFAAGWTTVALCSLAAYLLAVLVWGVALGRAAGQLAFVFMVCTHGISATHLLMKICPAYRRLPRRLALTLAVMAGLYWGLYAPAQSWCLNNLAVPVRLHDQLVLIRPSLNTARIKTGDLVAYRVERESGSGYQFREGIGLDHVLALPGDVVCFHSNRFEVNGSSARPLPWMPHTGELQVPRKHWLIWPRLAISNPGNQVRAVLPGAILNQVALVPEERLIGLPYQSWFGRRQQCP